MKLCHQDKELSKEIEADFVKYAMQAQDPFCEEDGSALHSNEAVDLRAAVARWMRPEAQGIFFSVTHS